jgi:hypothetical protein
MKNKQGTAKLRTFPFRKFCPKIVECCPVCVINRELLICFAGLEGSLLPYEIWIYGQSPKPHQQQPTHRARTKQLYHQRSQRFTGEASTKSSQLTELKVNKYSISITQRPSD